MFSPGPSNQPLPFTLNSVSSVLSPNMSPAAPNTRSKRRQNTKPKHPAAKKVKKFVRKPLSFKFRAGKLQYAAIFEPPKHDFSPDPHHSILDYFTDFFSNDIFELIVEQTNLYSVQTDSRSINITNDDVKDFIAITLIMGVVKMPSYRDYWSRFLRYPAVADIMPLKKYEKIRKYLHFADNSNINDDRYYKVRPIIEKIRLNCLKMKEEQRYSVDEMMVPYKGTRAGSRRQYLPKKPKNWGMKLFVRAGVSGLVYDFIPYGGEDTFRNHSFTEYEESLGLGAKVVLALCKTIEDKPAVVYFDNFFTSLELIHHLRQEYGIFSLGTIKSNRLRGCQNKLLADKVLAKKGRGASSQIVCNDTKLAVVRWYDNKPVTLASSFVDSHPMGKIQRYSKDTESRVEVNCPQIVKQYNAHMGGVDLADMLIALYRSNFKTKRWYMTMFSQSLDICVNNAWLLHRRDHADPKDRLPLKKFRIQIVSELLHKNRTRVTVSQENDPPKKIITPAAPRPTDAVRYDNNGHLPMFVSYGRCKYCKNGYTNITCSKCILRLCLVSKRNCFYNYHVK
ncbi:unnamed protein product [Parnassius mnemosyne]|uniref:PiggyBac transposable element-derived protein domain-containing protein n=1 Tax=Parnassius mnemosyne TaxID=213953 RepID=A0AAV1LFT9_9NEOP